MWPSDALTWKITQEDKTTLCYVPWKSSSWMWMMPHYLNLLIFNLQTRRAERRNKLTDRQHPPTTSPEPPGTLSLTQQLSRLEWVSHQTGTDRVYINHREHYVWQTSWTQSTKHLAVIHCENTCFTWFLIHWAFNPERKQLAALKGNASLCKQFSPVFVTFYFILLMLFALKE